MRNLRCPVMIAKIRKHIDGFPILHCKKRWYSTAHMFSRYYQIRVCFDEIDLEVDGCAPLTKRDNDKIKKKWEKHAFPDEDTKELQKFHYLR